MISREIDVRRFSVAIGPCAQSAANGRKIDDFVIPTICDLSWQLVRGTGKSAIRFTFHKRVLRVYAVGACEEM
jgi:hypothetical protein